MRSDSVAAGRLVASDPTKKRKAFSVGTRPAEVCGWERYPSSARSAITLRIEAGLRVSWRRFEMVRDPTGSPVSIYARTIEVRISRYLKLSGASVLIDP